MHIPHRSSHKSRSCRHPLVRQERRVPASFGSHEAADVVSRILSPTRVRTGIRDLGCRVSEVGSRAFRDSFKRLVSWRSRLRGQRRRGARESGTSGSTTSVRHMPPGSALAECRRVGYTASQARRRGLQEVQPNEVADETRSASEDEALRQRREGFAAGRIVLRQFCDIFRLRSEDSPHQNHRRGSKIRVFFESGRSAAW